MQVRSETPGDLAAVHAVNAAAFGREAEAELVDALRARVPSAISLVADEGGRVVGHILFTPVTLEGRADLAIAGLAPMAVAPEMQRRGVGAALIRAGLERCAAAGFDAVVVLGHPDYYPRHGFVPASRFGIASEYDAPDEAFMALELRAGALAGAAGTVRYHDAFAAVPA